MNKFNITALVNTLVAMGYNSSLMPQAKAPEVFNAAVANTGFVQSVPVRFLNEDIRASFYKAGRLTETEYGNVTYDEMMRFFLRDLSLAFRFMPRLCSDWFGEWIEQNPQIEYCAETESYFAVVDYHFPLNHEQLAQLAAKRTIRALYCAGVDRDRHPPCNADLMAEPALTLVYDKELYLSFRDYSEIERKAILRDVVERVQGFAAAHLERADKRAMMAYQADHTTQGVYQYVG